MQLTRRARICPQCQNSKVDLKRLLGIGTFSVERSLEIDPTLMDDSEEEEEEAAPVDEGGERSLGPPKRRRAPFPPVARMATLGVLLLIQSPVVLVLQPTMVATGTAMGTPSTLARASATRTATA